MAASWLSEMEGVTWHGCGVWLPGLADIDVMALQEGADGRTLVMGGCKRNPETHHPARLERQFEQFLDAGAEDKELRELRTLPRRRLVLEERLRVRGHARHGPDARCRPGSGSGNGDEGEGPCQHHAHSRSVSRSFSFGGGSFQAPPGSQGCKITAKAPILDNVGRPVQPGLSSRRGPGVQACS